MALTEGGEHQHDEDCAMTSFSPENITIDSAAAHPDGSFMFTAHFNDRPEVLFAFDRVGLKEECDGGWYLEYAMQIATKKNEKVNEEGLDILGQNLIQYLFETTTGTELK